MNKLYTNEMREKQITVSAYCRVSTDKDDQVNSLDSQIKFFNDYISNHGNWVMGEIYYDEGITGTSVKKRKAFNKMIQDGLNGKFHLVITKEVSRFARNTIDTLSYTRQLKERNIGVLFMNDNIYTLDSDGELRLTIMASIAQEESRKTSERVKWGQRRRMEQGIVFGYCPFGYSQSEGKLSINPSEAIVVKAIFTKFLNGTGIYSIAKELDEEGLKPMRAKRWNQATIYKILKNEKYVGDLVQRKRLTTDFLTKKTIINPNSDDLIIIKDHHEPIVSREIWNKTQSELKKREKTPEKKTRISNRYWCSGKIVCEECEKKYVSRQKKVSGKIRHYFWCLSSVRQGAKKIDRSGNVLGCGNLSIREFALTYLVECALKYIDLTKDALIKEIMNEIKALPAGEEAIRTDTLYSRIDEIKLKKKKVIDLAVDGLIATDDLRQQIATYDEEIKILLKQIATIENRNSYIACKDKLLKNLLKEIKGVLAFNTNATLAYKEIVNKIIVCRNKVVIIYFEGFDCGLKLKYKTTGAFTKYKIELEEIVLV